MTYRRRVLIYGSTMPIRTLHVRGLYFVIATLVAIGPTIAAEEVRLIAHRGGIVSPEYAENSPAALQAAIDRGYWMVEVDVRETKDGHLVVHHDADFRRFYGDPRRVADLTWDEIRTLRATPGDSRPLEFHELAALCRGRIRVMVDVKEPEHPRAFYKAMDDALRQNDLIDDAMLIGTDEAKAYFKGRIRLGISRAALEAAIDRGESVDTWYVLFAHGNELDRETVEFARAAGVTVVPSVNTFHYLGQDHRRAATADLLRLREWGVVYFQIDSVYDSILRSPDER